MSSDNIYTVKVTRYALNQLKETVNYISYALSEPVTAQKWLDLMEREMKKLSTMPNRYALTPEEPWRSEGVHRFNVKNFYVYYSVDEEVRTVWITAVIYARRNQEDQLNSMPLSISHTDY